MWRVVWCMLLAAGLPGPVAGSRLRFAQDGTFKIVQLTDLHYGEDPRLDQLTDQVQTTVLAKERPDLAVLSGDMVSGFAWDGSRGWYAARWQQLARPVRSNSSHYAVILGNHDGEADLSHREILALDIATSNTTLTQQGPEGMAGASNYYLDIYDSKGVVVAARVWMLDSNNRGCRQLRAGWGCVEPSTLAWVKRTAEQLPTVVPALAFIHIPVPQFAKTWNSQPTNGSKGERVSCPLLDSHAFHVLRDAGIRAIYSGHDHDNDYVGELHGIRLAYGRKSGYGCYGPPPGTLRGARVIVLRRGESAARSETWIRQEDGSRQDQGPTSETAKLRFRQYTCISFDGLLGWVWSWGARIVLIGPAWAIVALAVASVAASGMVIWRPQARHLPPHLPQQQRKWEGKSRGLGKRCLGSDSLDSIKDLEEPLMPLGQVACLTRSQAKAPGPPPAGQQLIIQRCNDNHLLECCSS